MSEQKKNFLVLFSYKKYVSLRIIKRLLRKNQCSEKNNNHYIERSHAISEKPFWELDRCIGRDIILQIHSFEIWKKCEDRLSDISDNRTLIPSSIVKHRISTMSDDIARDREKHSDHRRDKTREEKNESKKRKQLQCNSKNCRKKKWIESKSFYHKHPDKDHTLKYDHKKYDKSKSEKFPEKNTRSWYWLRKHEKYRPPLNLASYHPPSEKENHSKSCQLDKWESKIIEHSFELSECECLKNKRNTNKYYPKKENKWEKLVANKFANSIESNSKHVNSRLVMSWMVVIISRDFLWFSAALFWVLLVLIFVLWNYQDHLLNQSEQGDNGNGGSHIMQKVYKYEYILSPSEWQKKAFLLWKISQNNMAQAHQQNDPLHILVLWVCVTILVGKYRETHTYIHLHRSCKKRFHQR